MKKSDQRYQVYIDILKKELVPAMGCTEPVALAYCAAKARSVLGMLPTRVEIELSGNIIKNAKSVIVPNTGGEKGIETAAAIGILAGNADLELEVISHVTEEEKQAIIPYREQTQFILKQADSNLLLDIFVRVWNGDRSAAVRIVNTHTNIVYIEKDGAVLLNRDILSEQPETGTDYALLTVGGDFRFCAER